MAARTDAPVPAQSPAGSSENEGGWTGIDNGFTAGFSKALGLKEAAVVASAASKMKEKVSRGKGRQIATLKQKYQSSSGKKSRSVRAGEIRVPSGHESLESILVQQARVRVREKRIKKRHSSVRPASEQKKHDKKVDLTLRMMLGVRISVGRQASEPDREELLDEDFALVDQYKFSPAGTTGRLSTPSHELNKTFKFRDYAPKVFKNLRKMYGIKELPYTLAVAGNYDYLDLITNSKSGSFFFFSHNLKYIIKSMKRSEAKFFRRILPKYYEHHRQNPDSFLVRFCGMYMVKFEGKKIPFLVMNCIDGLAIEKIHRKYDLKGSSWHRKADEGDKVLKDNNLRESDGKFAFGTQREAILKALRADAEFLRDVNVMDYSVFMSIHETSVAKAPTDRRQLLRREYSNFFVFLEDEPAFQPLPSSRSSMEVLTEKQDDKEGEKKIDETSEEEDDQPDPTALARHIRARLDGGIESERSGPKEVYWMGIIDVLTEFTFLRQLESWYKAMVQDGSTVSCVKPEQYCERFVNFMTERTE
ncbi:unnamed protein product [Ascophyllum nodosum]